MIEVFLLWMGGYLNWPIMSIIGFLLLIPPLLRLIVYIPAGIISQGLIFLADNLDYLIIPISEKEYEYMLDIPIPFRGMDGEMVDMTATVDGPTLVLVDNDVHGNEIVTERAFSEDGSMEQTTFSRNGGVMAVRKFQKIKQ